MKQIKKNGLTSKELTKITELLNKANGQQKEALGFMLMSGSKGSFRLPQKQLFCRLCETTATAESFHPNKTELRTKEPKLRLKREEKEAKADLKRKYESERMER